MSQKQIEEFTTEHIGVETRSRSRSKTPSRVTDVVKDVAKNPTVDTIMEEIDVPRTTSKKVKQTVVTQESLVSSEEVVSSTTTVVTSTARKTNRRTQQQSQLQVTPIKKSGRKSKEVTQNEENMLLETSIEAIQQNGSPLMNFAYKEYKEAGEFWNKFPKTDYTYSELSAHRREIVPGQIGMPNMSRKSLELHHDRVVTMIQKRPEEESFIRKRYQSAQAPLVTSLQYDSGDELDYNHFQRKTVMSSSLLQHRRETIVRRMWTMITTVISTVFYYPMRLFRSEENLYKTRMNYEQGLFSRITDRLSSFSLSVLKRVYLIVSTVLLWDTWLLICRSSIVRDARRRRFLLLLLFLLPLLLLGAFYTSLTKEDASNYLHIPASLPKFSTQPLINYLTAWSWPAMPSLSLSWLLPAIFTSRHHKTFPSQAFKDASMSSLDDSSMNKILAHIDAYIDKIVAEKLQEKYASSQEEVMRMILNDNRLLMFVRNVVRENTVELKYELTDGDVEKIAERVKIYLSGYLQEMEKTLKRENGVEIKKVIGEVNTRMGEMRQVPSESEPNIDIIVEKLIESSEFSDWLLSYLSNWEKDSRAIHQDEIGMLKKEFDALRLALAKEIEENSNLKQSLEHLNTDQDALRAEIIAANMKTQSNLDTLLSDLSARLAKLETSQGSFIDNRVRKHLLLLFEHPGDDSVSLPDLILWIKSIFVTKDYLEQRLQSLNKDGDAKLKVQLDQLSAHLLDEVLIKVQKQVNSQNIVKHSVTEIDETSIERIVRAILAVYDADKTGLPDYALETAGGQVISTRCTQFYQRRTAQISIFGIPLWYQSSTPRVAITPSVHPGQCWAFTGFPGYLVIQLSRLIHVTGFTVEHIPKTLAPNGTLDSAPKDFIVMGLTHEFDKEPAIFGTYQYLVDGEPLQYFPVQNKTIVVPYEFVEMRIDTNHGNKNYTCLYRVRVHGIPLP